MQNLFALIIQLAAAFKQVLAFLSKEFFLFFLYGVSGSVLTLVIWLLLVYVFPNRDIYIQLCNELNGSEKYAILFLFGVSIGCIYLYRVLLAAVQSAILNKQ